MPVENKPQKVPKTLLFIFFFISVVILVAGYFYYYAEREATRKNIYKDLATISKLKIEQISNWHQYRLNDANEIKENQSFIHDVDIWLRNKNDTAVKSRIYTWIESIAKDSNYSNIFLLDKKEQIQISLVQEKLCSDSKKLISEAVSLNRPIISYFDRDLPDTTIHLDVIVPLIKKDLKNQVLIGYILLRVNPEVFLFPLIQSWPTSSRTAETLLIKQEKDSVLFLNQLKHKQNAALKFKISMKDTLLPATQALLGRHGIFEGVDYRGIKVLSYLSNIKGTPWFMVAKEDSDEIFNPLIFKSRLIGVFVAFLIFFTAVSMYMLYKDQQSKFFEEKYKLELDRKVLEKHFDYLIRHANDIILLLDKDGKIIEANDKALSTYGYTKDEILEMNIRNIRAEETLALVTQDMNEVLKKRGLLFETIHCRKDKSKFPVEVSSRAIEIEGTTYLQSIIRDITERKETEEKIEKLNSMYAMLSETNQIIVRVKDREKLFNEICTIANVHGKFAYACLGIVNHQKEEIDIIAASGGADKSSKNLKISYSTPASETYVFEKAVRTKSIALSNDIDLENNSIDCVIKARMMGFRSVAVIPIKFEEKVYAVLTLYSIKSNYFDEQQIGLLDEVGLDISFALENIKAEEIRIESETKLLNLFANSPVGIVMLDDLDRIISVNKEFERIFQYRQEEIRGLNINSLVAEDEYSKEATSLSLKTMQGNVVQKESVRRRKDGSLINVKIFGVPIIVGEEQVGIYGMYIDITEQKNADKEILLSLSLLQATLESTADGILVVDTNGKISQFNNRFVELWRIPKTILDAKDDNKALEFVLDQLKYPEAFISKVKGLYNYPEQTSFDLLEFKDGRFFERYSQPQKINGKSVGRVWSFRDITERKKAEEALKEREYWLKESQRIGRIGSYDLDIPSGKWISSDVLDDVFGIAHDAEKTLESWSALVHPDEREIMLKYFLNDVVGAKKSFNKEYRIIRQNDGAVRWLWGLGELSYDKNGNPVKMFGTIQDITERKKAEEELITSEEQFRLLFENSSIGIGVADLNGKLLAYNDALLNQGGYTQDDMQKVDNVAYLYYNIEHRKEILMQLQKNGVVKNFSTQFKRKDGLPYHALLSLSKTIFKGNPAVQAIVEDITERKNAVDALAESEEKFRTLFEQSPDGIMIHVDGIFQYANPATLKLFKAKNLQEIIGRKIIDFVHPDYRAKVIERIKRSLSIGEVSPTIEEKFICLDGEAIDVEVNGVPISYQGKPAMQVIARDISERKRFQERVQLLAHMVSSISECVSITDMQDKLIFVNPAFAKTYGYEEEELIGKNISIVRSPNNDKKITGRILPDTIAGGWEGEILQLRKDGTEFPIHLSTSIIKDVYGKPIALVGVASDITEKKFAEEEIRKLYRGVEQSPAIIFITDVHGSIEYVNAKFCEITGYSYADVIGKNPRILKSDYHTKKEYEYLWNTILSGKEIRREIKNKRKNGEYYWARASISPIKNSKNEITHFIAIQEDVTEYKKAEKALIESEEKFRILAEESPNMIFINKKGRVVYANKKCEELMGYTKEEFYDPNFNFLDLITEEHKEKVRKIFAKRFLGPELPAYEYTLVTKTKTKIDAILAAKVIDYEGDKALLGIVTDITERKKAEVEIKAAKEKAEKSEQIKTEFLAQMSHEIRTPINIIQGFNNYIRDEFKANLNEDLIESFSSIDSATKRIIRTVDMVLNMSEIQAKVVKVFPQMFDINEEVLKRLCKEYKKSAEAKNLSFDYELRTKDTKIYADDYCVIEILDNLLDNAIKYTNQGKVEVIVNRNKEKKLYVEVKDSGIGISEDYIPHLFEAFSQEDHGYSRKYEGNGLGLALVKNYCDLNNIQIEVESKKNIGSIFRITFD